MLLTLTATLLIVGVPVGIVWGLRAGNVVTSLWIGVLLTVALTYLAAALGSFLWERRRTPSDRSFSDLLLFGHLRRRRAEKRLTNAVALFERLEGQRQTPDRRRALEEIAEAVDVKDIYLDGHSRRVARYAVMTAERMELSAAEVALIGTAATVHDVGKLHVPAEIIEKPGKLTEAEYEVMKRHAEEGGRMAASLDDTELASVVRHHHERYDGGGYPTGLAGSQIPLGARVIAVADAFDAMTAVRPYRAATRHKGALDVLRSESGTQFDPEVVRAFLSYYSGRRRGLLLFAGLAAPAVWRQHTLPVAAAVAIAAGPAFLALQGIFSDQEASGQPRVTAVAGSVAPSPPVGLGPSAGPRIETQRAPTAVRAARARGAATAAVRGPRSQPEAAGPPGSEPAGGAGTTPSPPSPAGNPPPPAPGPPAAPAPPPPASPPPAPSPAPSAPPPAAPQPTAAPPPAPPPSAPPPAPATPTKDECKKGGHAGYGYANQGQCIKGANGGGSGP